MEYEACYDKAEEPLKVRCIILNNERHEIEYIHQTTDGSLCHLDIDSDYRSHLALQLAS